MERDTKFASRIQAAEVNSLLGAFWGPDSNLANFHDPLMNYRDCMKVLKAAITQEENDGYKLAIDQLGGRTISFGMRRKGNLIAHSALIVRPWGEVETGGSIISEAFKEMSLMKEINIRKKEALGYFGKLGFLLTSYVLLGSRSVSHGYEIFNFPELKMNSYYCNFGPYIFSLPKGSKKYSRRVLDLSVETESSYLCSSAQVLGISNDKPPFIDTGGNLGVASKLLSYYPHRVNLNDDKSKHENSTTNISDKLILYTIYQPTDIDNLTRDVSGRVLEGKATIIRVPVCFNTFSDIEQLVKLVGNNLNEITVVPTGLTVVDGYWALCFAGLTKEKAPSYLDMLRKVKNTYSGSLYELSSTLIEIAENHL